jgi:putative FmdB family regulatory protein
MPTYEYLCDTCGHRFETRQRVSEAPLSSCPECRGPLARVVGTGVGILRGGPERGRRESCAYETTGQTCCGRSVRCDSPDCRD